MAESAVGGMAGSGFTSWYWLKPTRSFNTKVIVKEGRKDGNVLFNDAFYLRLYSVGHMVEDHSDTERKPAATITWVKLNISLRPMANKERNTWKKELRT